MEYEIKTNNNKFIAKVKFNNKINNLSIFNFNDKLAIIDFEAISEFKDRRTISKYNFKKRENISILGDIPISFSITLVDDGKIVNSYFYEIISKVSLYDEEGNFSNQFNSMLMKIFDHITSEHKVIVWGGEGTESSVFKYMTNNLPITLEQKKILLNYFDVQWLFNRKLFPKNELPISVKTNYSNSKRSNDNKNNRELKSLTNLLNNHTYDCNEGLNLDEILISNKKEMELKPIMALDSIGSIFDSIDKNKELDDDIEKSNVKLFNKINEVFSEKIPLTENEEETFFTNKKNLVNELKEYNIYDTESIFHILKMIFKYINKQNKKLNENLKIK